MTSKTLKIVDLSPCEAEAISRVVREAAEQGAYLHIEARKTEIKEKA